MTSTTYQGWTNYETWVVKLWIDNEEGPHLYWRDRALEAWDFASDNKPNQFMDRSRNAQQLLADWLKDEHEEALPELQGLAADLLNAAMDEVNWHEIADAMLRDMQENAEGDTDGGKYTPA